jgi:hypothetical protein
VQLDVPCKSITKATAEVTDEWGGEAYAEVLQTRKDKGFGQGSDEEQENHILKVGRDRTSNKGGVCSTCSSMMHYERGISTGCSMASAINPTSATAKAHKTLNIFKETAEHFGF